MVYVYIGLTFMLLLQLELGYTATCGSLEFEQDTVTEGGVATLTYKPYNIHAARYWYSETTNLTLLYDSGKSNNDIKYAEAAQGRTFTLSIKRVVLADTGNYIVRCDERGTYSDRATLNVIGESQTDCGSLTVKANTLAEGEIARLEFTIHPGRQIKWEKKINSTFQQLFNGGDYYMPKYGEKTTVHNLLIYNSDYSHSGEYRVNCDPAVSNTVYLNIVPTPPTVPEFSGNESIPECKECILAELNVPVNVECFVRGGTEPVVLNMFKDGNIISNVNKSITGSKNGVNIYHARHIFIPSKMDFDVVFTCTVKNPALRVELVMSAPLYIRADPETVKIKVKQTTENEPSEIQCITKKGRPPRKSSILIDNNEEVKTEKTSEIKTDHTYSVTTTVVKNFTRFDNQKKVMCCSVILNRICSNTSNVNVLFPPKIVRVTEMMKSNEDNGETELKLRCSVEASNPRSSIEWKGVKKVTRTLTIKEYTNHSDTHGWTYFADWVFNLTKDDNGRSMRCEVKNPQFPNLELVQSYRPNITYAPIITVSVSGQENGVAYLGDDVFLTCHVDSNPPSTLSWYNQTALIKELYGAKNFDLPLVNISFDHSQTYTCTARNSIGSTKSKNVTLIVKDASEKPVTKPTTGQQSASSSVAVAVIGCVIALVVAVIAVIAFLYRRKKRQNTSLERKGTYQMKIEDRKPSVHLVGNEPVYNNVATSSNGNAVEEQPEYAFVVPKNERENANACPESDNDAENESPENEKGDNLVYAELDLNQDSNNAVKRPLLIRDEPTEYVSIDFHKTGTVTMNEDGGEI
ncbi:titin-like isoform X2 [Mercenaria mercenaria]|uniref:titin-like isoform X2 n=1 Tax=Mercenaria mercenaria TaxID=6596 RepID=UPI00234EFAF0|nr:titin-like isoform X2 [Mercenaria mercenaria]